MTPFTGDIIMFAGIFAIRNFGLCNGQLLAINSNVQLYALIGTTYGGDGISSFTLPEMRGRIPVHRNDGSGIGGLSYSQGYKGGSSTVTLSEANLPVHNHDFQVSTQDENSSSPNGQVVGKGKHFLPTSATSTHTGTMYLDTVANEGSSHSLNNMAPYQAINFLIALQGVFPSRN
ncbi:phage tail protein [Shewanella sp. 10N.286.45.A1]|uniref:phage tail protein n=1 Tax=Shewanella sp. 10N.286.45.A1 TaxID=3229694 RepID=UPI0035538F23